MKKLMWVVLSLGFFLSSCGTMPQPHSVLIAAGGHHTCALAGDGSVKCWGSNERGQLGDGDTNDSPVPVAVSGLGGDTIALAAGGRHSCALTARGAVRCWGDNDRGQLGSGDTLASPIPVDVRVLAQEVVAISAGDHFTCALTSQGAVRCWGADEKGQLGRGTTTDSLIPVQVEGLGDGVTAIAAGGAHACALLAAGGVKCWGSNENGQLGNKTRKTSLKPVDVSGLSSGALAITAGGGETCALMSSGAVKCWGWNGDESHGHEALKPEDVTGLDGVVTAIAAGAQHTCAVTGEQVECWGSNYVGQLGNAALAASSVPLQVSGLGGGALAIAAGAFHTCVLSGNARVACWGQNYQGELGDGNRPYSATPVNVLGLRTATFASLTATAAPTFTPAPTPTTVPPTLIPWPVPATLAAPAPGSPVVLTTVNMLDALTGWGLDPAGHILRTADGGLTWKCVTPPSGTFAGQSFWPVDANTAWAAALPVTPGSEGCARMANCHLGAMLWHTTNGGASWQANKTWQPDKPLARPSGPAAADGASQAGVRGLDFLDPATGWALFEDWGTGTNILTVLARTSDSGQSLREIWRTSGIGRYTGPAFLNKQVGYLGHDDTTFFDRLGGLPTVQDYLDGKQAPYLEKTDDGGYTWESVFLPRLAPLPAELRAPASITRHMLCGIRMLRLIAPQGLGAQVTCRVTGRPQPYLYHYLSPDAGASWRSWLATGNESFLDPATGWRLDAAGRLQQTANGGLDWVTLGSAPWHPAALDFVDQRSGWLIIANGADTGLMRTGDGGHHWLDLRPVVANP